LVKLGRRWNIATAGFRIDSRASSWATASCGRHKAGIESPKLSVPQALANFRIGTLAVARDVDSRADEACRVAFSAVETDPSGGKNTY
jgi:hypothetical protein